MIMALWRLALIVFFFTGATFLSTLFGAPYLLPLSFFLVVTGWILVLPFKKAISIAVPLLFCFDILQDGQISPFFFFGFLLAVAVAFFSVRIQKENRLSMATIFYILITSSFAYGSLSYQTQTLLPGEVLLGHFLFSGVFFLPILISIEWLESKLDTSFREAAQKIR
jgi:hypothetical protein